MLAVLLLVAAAIALTGCQEQFQDLDTQFYADPGEIRQEYPVKVTNPDSLTIYRNADGFPNLALICVNGVPFTATSSTHQGGLRQVLEVGGLDVTVLCSQAPTVDEGDVPMSEGEAQE